MSWQNYFLFKIIFTYKQTLSVRLYCLGSPWDLGNIFVIVYCLMQIIFFENYETAVILVILIPVNSKYGATIIL
jgi:hypothetical protein